MLVSAASPILPPWLVLPAAAATMLVIAAHILVMPSLGMPASRRRIRTTNAFLMLFATALLGYAFGMATQSAPRTFVVVWTAIVALLVVIVTIAMIDVANTMRLGVVARRRMRGELREDLGRELGRSVGPGGGAGDDGRR